MSISGVQNCIFLQLEWSNPHKQNNAYERYHRPPESKQFSFYFSQVMSMSRRNLFSVSCIIFNF